MDENEAYLSRVDAWVLQGIQRGLSTLNDLAVKLPGVFPTCIRDSINRLSRSGEISSDVAQSILKSTVLACVTSAPSETDKLPVPHPLDFEWRFSWDASERIFQVAHSLALKSDEILLLSTPSVFYYAIQNKLTSNIRYIGDKTVVTVFLCAIAKNGASCDFLDGKAYCSSHAGVVVIDPPWYEELMFSFMWLAAASCKIGGYVVLSFPPEGTRPGIKTEWQNFLTWAEQLGMTQVIREESLLPYDSPFFEANALYAEGINVTRNWRKGILCIFKKLEEVQASKPTTKALDKWNEAQLGMVRLKMRETACKDEIDPRLTAIVPGEIFPTVSRRDPRRELANVWTSGNRIFNCPRPDVLEHVVTALQNGEAPAKAVELFIRRELAPIERAAVEESVAQLVRIKEKETREMFSRIHGRHDI